MTATPAPVAMSVEFQGHVSKMEVGTSDRVKVHICPSMSRMEGKPLVIEMSRTEAQHYMPGSGVLIQIRPHGSVGPAFTPSEPGKQS